MTRSEADQTQSLRLEHGGRMLILEFGKTADRWSQSVHAGDTPQSRDLIHSVEGSAGEDWPSSPVFQELSVEDRGDHAVALLVGMAGKSHWSCSVSPFETEDEIGWEFDVACLAKLPPHWLGSTYATSDEARGLGVSIDAADSCHLNDEAANEIVLRCRQKSLELPQTFCWSYRIVLRTNFPH